MSTMDLRRHMELFDPHYFNEPVHIIGAGATGSWLALSLAKLGIKNITVWDFDDVEEHNIPNQAFRVNAINKKNWDYVEESDIGKPKVDALNELVYNATGMQIKTKNEAVTAQTRLSGIVFMMTDTMKSRKEIFEGAIKLKPNVKLLIEPRMGLDMGRIYIVNPLDMLHVKEYEKTLYTDDEASVSACGASQTVITTALSITSTCARQLINWHNELKLPNEILQDYAYNNFFTTTWGE